MTVKRVAVLFCLFVLAASARAAVPPVISYQGRLLQPSGAAVPDGTVSITFSIYDAPTGGTALWTETNPSVFVKGGLFSVMLGSVTPMPPDIFNGADRYFGIQVGSDAETSPRQKIASAAYAHSAGTAETAKVADNGTPVGGIIMWSGSKDAIPAGWALCDGTNGTPNLQDKFILGAGAIAGVGGTGGNSQITLSVAQLPPHTHGVNDPGHSHLEQIANVNGYGGADGAPAGSGQDGGYHFSKTTGSSKTGITIQSTGGGQPVNIMPPYYALCFIMCNSQGLV